MHEREQLNRIERIVQRTERKVDELLFFTVPRLTSIQIVFSTQGDATMNKPSDVARAASGAPAPGSNPITLTVGQSTVASVIGFDQFGNAFTPVPAPVWTIDNSTFDSIVTDPTTPTSEDVTSLAAGVANLTATVVTAEGLTVSDTEQITNIGSVPVLTSVQIQFATPITPAAKKK